MSKEVTVPTVRHTLEALEKLDGDGFKTLNSGYLSDLALAIKLGRIPTREVFARAVGLYLAHELCMEEVPMDWKKKPWEHWDGTITPRLLAWAQTSNVLPKVNMSLFEFDVDMTQNHIAMTLDSYGSAWLFANEPFLVSFALHANNMELLDNRKIAALNAEGVRGVHNGLRHHYVTKERGGNFFSCGDYPASQKIEAGVAVLVVWQAKP